ncbi:hypothetical protein GT043_21295, partial [Streptomyces sp. SID2131]|nr:hypothetical protein [Streptomyces sp. SID2131]
DAPTVELPEPGPPDLEPEPRAAPVPADPAPLAWPVEPPGEEPTETALRPEEPTETALRPEEPPSADR